MAIETGPHEQGEFRDLSEGITIVRCLPMNFCLEMDLQVNETVLTFVRKSLAAAAIFNDPGKVFTSRGRKQSVGNGSAQSGLSLSTRRPRNAKMQEEKTVGNCMCSLDEFYKRIDGKCQGHRFKRISSA